VSISIHTMARSPTWAPAGNVRLKLVRDAFVPETPGGRYAIAMRYMNSPSRLLTVGEPRRRVTMSCRRLAWLVGTETDSVTPAGVM
jgi:hypothetical protein